MNAQHFARTTYGRPETPFRSPRQIEYDLFARVTGQMRRLVSGPAPRHGDLVQALHDNLRLWRALASDVSRPGNGLPPDLRARLRYLGDFTVQHSRKVMRQQAEIGVLIDINTAIMRGLRGEGEV